jgi:photosystem II stability/assembly factor-like uncharacterized protein
MRLFVFIGTLVFLGFLVHCGDPKPCPTGSNCTEGSSTEPTDTDGGIQQDDTPPKPTSSQWQPATSNTKVDLYGVSMPTSKLAWAVGANGTILHSKDSGATWTAQNAKTTKTLYGVSFIDASYGWAVGEDGTILRTINGGADWNALNTPVSEHLRAVQFIDKDHGFAVGDGFSLLRTTNSGDNWNPTSFKLQIDLLGLFFTSKTEGVCVGSEGTIVKTTNGARDVTTEATATDKRFNAAFFLDKATGWAVGADGRLMKTTSDGGWEQQTLKTDSELYGIGFGNAKRGWIIGKNGVLLGTQNGGTSWQSEARSSLPDLHGIAVHSATTGVIVGKSGTILLLRDAKGECTDGETRPCYTGPSGTKDVGECKGGTQTCQAGIWGSCEGEVTPKETEICFNDKDDNCNGKPDSEEQCPDCQTGDRRDCYSGNKETQGVGSCRTGEQVCVGNEWGECQDDVLPKKEECNGADDDCDGQIDNNLTDPPACDNTYGVCGTAKKTCKEGGWRACDAASFGADYEKDETKCDGKDNDCDGTIDEGCPCTTDGESRDCYGGPPKTKDTGECKGGKQTCTSGKWTTCEGETKPTDEICGDNKDNNCNGTVDEKNQFAALYNNSHTQIPSSPSLEPTAGITVEGWFNVTNISNRTAHALISKTQQGGYAIYINFPRPGNISFRVWTKGASDFTTASATRRDYVKLNTWHHIAGTYDGNAVRLWIDGKKVAETAVKGTIDYPVSDIPLIFGAEADKGGPPRRNALRYTGLIAQVRIANKALYSADFTPDCMLSKTPETVGLWLLNSGSGQTATDETGQHNGTHNSVAIRESIRCPGYAPGGCKQPTP